MSVNGANKSKNLTRVAPDISRLIPDESGNMTMSSHSSNGHDSSTVSIGPTSSAPPRGALNYEDSDLNSITRSQMFQDLIAYRYDLEFCQTQLMTQEDITPQELRTLQIRTLDCAHNIRHCKHRIQVLDTQARLTMAHYPPGPHGGPGSGSGAYRSGGTATVTGKNKRQRIRKSEESEVNGTRNDNDAATSTAVGGEADQDTEGDGADDSIVAAGTDPNSAIRISPTPSTHSLQRLGYWDCRLCRSRKYLEAGSNRVPSAPCKWPLKDISKMINHFLDLHTEHTPEERCNELGDALARNRGPFEYWLTRTKGQEVEETNLVDDYVRMLQGGSLPDAMRGLLRAATMFPNTISNSYKK